MTTTTKSARPKLTKKRSTTEAGDADALKIIRLRAENVKRLTAFDLRPDGQTVVLGGEVIEANDLARRQAAEKVKIATDSETTLAAATDPSHEAP